MMLYVAYVVAAAAIAVMGVNVFRSIQLGRSILGGEVGEKWKALTALIGFFFVGYLLAPLSLLLELPVAYRDVLMFGVFLGGAIFVLVVIGIMRDVLAFLKLLR